MIIIDFHRGLSRQECIDSLVSTFGNEAPHKATIYRWFNQFHRGRTTLTDKSRESRSKLATVPENISSVRELTLQDRHVIYREIQDSLGVGMNYIQTILYEHLAVKKLHVVFRTI
jgi:hypothetical protein